MVINNLYYIILFYINYISIPSCVHWCSKSSNHITTHLRVLFATHQHRWHNSVVLLIGIYFSKNWFLLHLPMQINCTSKFERVRSTAVRGSPWWEARPMQVPMQMRVRGSCASLAVVCLRHRPITYEFSQKFHHTFTHMPLRSNDSQYLFVLCKCEYLVNRNMHITRQRTHTAIPSINSYLFISLLIRFSLLILI